jgi:hypothetical protein
MPDHMKMQLNISGMTKRNQDLPLVTVNKVCGHSLILRLVYLSIGAIQPFDIETSRQKLMRCLQHDVFISLKHPDSMMPF